MTRFVIFEQHRAFFGTLCRVLFEKVKFLCFSSLVEHLLDLGQLHVDLDGALEDVDEVHVEVWVIKLDLVALIESFEPRVRHLHEVFAHDRRNFLHQGHLFETFLDLFMCDWNHASRNITRLLRLLHLLKLLSA